MRYAPTVRTVKAVRNITNVRLLRKKQSISISDDYHRRSITDHPNDKKLQSPQALHLFKTDVSTAIPGPNAHAMTKSRPSPISVDLSLCKTLKIVADEVLP